MSDFAKGKAAGAVIAGLEQWLKSGQRLGGQQVIEYRRKLDAYVKPTPQADLPFDTEG